MMRIKCTVRSVEVASSGYETDDILHVTLNGRQVTAARERPEVQHTIGVPNTGSTKRAFFVGRRVDIVVLPR